MAKDEVYFASEQKILSAQINASPSLYLQASGLSELPPCLKESVDLELLSISNSHLTKLPDWLSQLQNLHTLVLSTNHKLEDLPEWIGSFPKLKRLALESNEILRKLPKTIGDLTELQRFSFSSDVDRFVGPLPESMQRLKHLKELEIYRTNLTKLPEWICEFKKLEILYVYENCLTEISDSLFTLPDLTHLSLAANPIRNLSDRVGDLSKLRSLQLGGTQIETLPTTMRKLKALKVLSLGWTPLSNLPHWIGELESLTSLDLANTDTITAIWRGLNAWALIARTGTEAPLCLTALPDTLNDLPNLRYLYLHGNDALGLPPEVLGPGWGGHREDKIFENRASAKEILTYYFKTQKGRRPLNEAKLIFVGRGGAGKSCLIKRLINKTFNNSELETPGIEIKPWEVIVPDGDRVRLHVWDFGGQEILHATHQFFLTERTIYLLVLSGREGSPTQDAEYWLQLIRSFGGDSSVIIALNKSKLHPFDVNRGLLLEKYPQIVKFVQTDCACNEYDIPVADGDDSMGIQALRDAILDRTETLEHRKTDFPTDWFAIKERLASMEENFVTWDEYQEICRQLGENDSKAQHHLAGFLHILGVALNYSDDPRLRDTHVLNPRWVTEGIYSILRWGHKDKGKYKGTLEPSDLGQTLDKVRYPTRSHEFLLALMEKFQLCFRLAGSRNSYLVPELLGENQPNEIKELLAESGLGFRYQYEVLPEGLLPRFIVQTHVYSEANPQWRWRTGAVLERGDCRAVVRADSRERRVDVHITGSERQRRDLLAIIRERFDEQHRELRRLAVDQRVPVSSEPGVTVSYQHLLLLEADGDEFYRPEGARKKYRVADLLNGIESSDTRSIRRFDAAYIESLQTPMIKKHVFLSYCHANSAEATQLHAELRAANENVWWDQDIPPGADWKFEIDQAMQDAYAVVLCLSKETEARSTSGIYPEAASAIGALREYAPGSIFLIPVRFSDCKVPRFEIDATRRLDRLQHVDLFPSSNRSMNITKLIDAIQRTENHP